MHRVLFVPSVVGSVNEADERGAAEEEDDRGQEEQRDRPAQKGTATARGYITLHHHSTSLVLSVPVQKTCPGGLPV